MSGSPRVTVAGAGVLGLTTALALADAGCEVTVCDPGGPNASSIAAGMIAPVFEAVLDQSARPHLDLLMLARDLWPGLAQRAGIFLDRSGALAVGDEPWLEKVAAGFSALQLRPMDIGGEAARGLAPGLSDAFDEALLSREDWRVDAPTSLGALASAARAAGVTFQRRIVRGRGDADVLVIATGAKEGLEDVAPELARLSPIKGHIVRVAAESAGATVRGEGVYAAPGSGLAFGATMEPGRGDVAIEEGQAMPLLAAGLRLFPGLRGAPIQMAAGVRATTPDGLPMVGAGAAPGVMLAVGSRRNGWLLAPLVATMVAACVTGRDAGPYAAALDPARFGA
ncbi:MAG: FAD-dependent oxidoreductase [Phenylobacterium sp.]|uniref:NAD(P)/FAD-dependent oxidoreductase n=1 Tax=Phenylobacterium sp. TaxID=1871053 RepID=UPI00120D9C13|nr:FAD-dependent oxidoreductase [Phenylobacterium sp.]TAJ69723.1 MAG: FAD-dependent oxidoreductase [Phenylobacterium sp.]